MKSGDMEASDIAPLCLGWTAIVDEACRLADTGRYANFTDIEHVMPFGYSAAGAREVLDQYPVRKMLNGAMRRCLRAAWFASRRCWVTQTS